MTLSEREQELFDTLERQLQDDDPQLAAALAPPPALSFSTRWIVLGVLAALAGFLTLLIGVMLAGSTASILVGVLGFAATGAGIRLALVRRPSAGRSA